MIKTTNFSYFINMAHIQEEFWSQNYFYRLKWESKMSQAMAHDSLCEEFESLGFWQGNFFFLFFFFSFFASVQMQINRKMLWKQFGSNCVNPFLRGSVSSIEQFSRAVRHQWVWSASHHGYCPSMMSSTSESYEYYFRRGMIVSALSVIPWFDFACVQFFLVCVFSGRTATAPSASSRPTGVQSLGCVGGTVRARNELCQQPRVWTPPAPYLPFEKLMFQMTFCTQKKLAKHTTPAEMTKQILPLALLQHFNKQLYSRRLSRFHIDS